MFEGWIRDYSDFSEAKKRNVNKSEAFSEHKRRKVFKPNNITELAFTEWKRFRASYPGVRLNNSEIVDIQKLHDVKFSTLDISAMLIFDRAYFTSKENG